MTQNFSSGSLHYTSVISHEDVETRARAGLLEPSEGCDGFSDRDLAFAEDEAVLPWISTLHQLKSIIDIVSDMTKVDIRLLNSLGCAPCASMCSWGFGFSSPPPHNREISMCSRRRRGCSDRIIPATWRSRRACVCTNSFCFQSTSKE